MKAITEKSKIVRAIYNEQRLTIIFGVLFVLSLLPILAIAFYNHPGIDDYNYGVATRIAYMETHDIAAVLAASFKTVAETYNTWQGTFSSVFLFTLQPAVFDENLYPLTTFVMLFMLIGSTYYLLQTILVKVLALDRKHVVIIGVPVLFFCIQSLPSPVEGFFWYNGATHYTFFYSSALFLLGACIYLYNFGIAWGGGGYTKYFSLPCCVCWSAGAIIPQP